MTELSTSELNPFPSSNQYQNSLRSKADHPLST